MTSTPSHNDDTGPAPTSTRIRERISRAGQRFHANDNIAAFIEPGDLDALEKLV